MNIGPEDPRLTAYVLGELDDRECREIETAIGLSPELQEAVEEIRSATRILDEALQAREETRLTPGQVLQVVEASRQTPVRRSRTFWYGWAGLSAAASLLLVFVLTSHQDPREMVSLSAPERLPSPRSVEPVPEGRVHDVSRQPGNDQEAPLSKPRAERELPAETNVDEKRVEQDAPSKVPSKNEQQLHPETRVQFSAQPVAPATREIGLQSSALTIANALEEGRGVSAEGFSAAGELSVAVPAADPRRSVDRMDSNRAPQVPGPFNTEAYDRIVDNPFLSVTQNPLSTFSIDVDTASYANVRRFLQQGVLPPKDAVRIEELVNYFDYDYPHPEGARPFSVTVEATAAPWQPKHRLLKVGLKGKVVETQERPAANLVFLLDVSGSMDSPNKLPLLKQAIRMLIERLKEEDRVSIVVYAGASGLVLPSTPGSDKAEIFAALERLHAGGSTNGAAGIQLAYQVADSRHIAGGINRVILATDGDFNVGMTNQGDLTRMIEEKARTGVFLTVLGFGMGNYKDSTLEKLADQGNGNYGYIDTLSEARKLLVEQLNGTLVTIAKDVKIQVEFNPTKVSAYRLIGYENRLLRREDFNDDTKDAGEIGAGHTVTALYEVVPVGVDVPTGSVDPLKYQSSGQSRSPVATSEEMLTVKLRYKQPTEETSQLLEVPFVDDQKNFARASVDLRFAAAVASFGMLLRDSEYKGNASFGAVLEMAGQGIGEDRNGYRREFLELVRIAQRISVSRQ